jgi:adenylyltransferase/sulfurtransferase
MDEDEVLRYSRQIMIKEIGLEGQRRLGKAKVLVAGLGGLGSICAYYLAAAGVGRLRILDRDRVELSNLNRQILHSTENIGMEKTASALRRLNSLNPHCEVEAFCCELNNENAMLIAGGCDAMVDATDNLEARHVLNRASLSLGIPLVHGAVGGLNGMVCVFMPGKGPCLECLFPSGPRREEAPGVLGAVAGVIASVQALETIKILLGLGSGLIGRLLYLYGFDMRWKAIAIEKNPYCQACSGLKEE